MLRWSWVPAFGEEIALWASVLSCLIFVKCLLPLLLFKMLSEPAGSHSPVCSTAWMELQIIIQMRWNAYTLRGWLRYMAGRIQKQRGKIKTKKNSLTEEVKLLRLRLRFLRLSYRSGLKKYYFDLWCNFVLFVITVIKIY